MSDCEKWEYAVDYVGGNDAIPAADGGVSMEDYMNERGRDGWELGSVLSHPSLGFGQVHLFWKRRVPGGLIVKGDGDAPPRPSQQDDHREIIAAHMAQLSADVTRERAARIEAEKALLLAWPLVPEPTKGDP